MKELNYLQSLFQSCDPPPPKKRTKFPASELVGRYFDEII